MFQRCRRHGTGTLNGARAQRPGEKNDENLLMPKTKTSVQNEKWQETSVKTKDKKRNENTVPVIERARTKRCDVARLPKTSNNTHSVNLSKIISFLASATNCNGVLTIVPSEPKHSNVAIWNTCYDFREFLQFYSLLLLFRRSLTPSTWAASVAHLSRNAREAESESIRKDSIRRKMGFFFIFLSLCSIAFWIIVQVTYKCVYMAS